MRMRVRVSSDQSTRTSRAPASKALAAHRRARGAAARGAEMMRVWPGWTLTPIRTMKPAYFCKSCSKFCIVVSFLF